MNKQELLFWSKMLAGFVLPVAAITSPAYKEITTLQTTHLFVFDEATLLAENLHADTLYTFPVWTYFGIALCAVAYFSTTTVVSHTLKTMGRVVLFLLLFYRQMEARHASLEGTTFVAQPVYSMLFIVIVMLLPQVGGVLPSLTTKLASSFSYKTNNRIAETETLFKL